MIRPISAVLTIAGTLVLVGCDEQQRQSTNSIFRALGVNDSVGDIQAQESAPAVAYVEPVVVEPEVQTPEPEPVCETHMWRFNLYDCHGNLLGPA